MISFLPSNFDFPGPLGRPSFLPEALALAKPIFVRSEIKSRSISANNEKTDSFFPVRYVERFHAKIGGQKIIFIVCLNMISKRTPPVLLQTLYNARPGFKSMYARQFTRVSPLSTMTLLNRSPQK